MKNMKTEWNLKLLYKSHTDPQIEKDVRNFESVYEAFEKKYENNDFTKSKDALSKALTDFETLSANPLGSRAILYFYYAKDLNGSDTKAEAEINKITERLTKASNRVIFFQLVLGKIPETKQKTLLKSSKLKHFSYFLEVIFKQSKYNLTEAEEKILSLKNVPAQEMWVSNQEKLLSKQCVVWKKVKLPLPQAMGMISTLPTKERHSLHTLIMEKLQSVSDFAEAEINAVYTDKKISDELRGRKNPYDSTLLNHETEEKTVFALMDAVVRNNKISHKFYSLKAKLLKLNKLTYADRNVGIGKTNKEISFEQGLEITRTAFESLDADFAKVLNNYLKNGQIDVYPKQGKTGGADCSGSSGNPTFVLLNHLPQMKDVMTLAHEMGHAIHTEYSHKTQTSLYQSYTTAVAEVASTFFERVVFDEVFKTLSPKEQIVALHDRINDEVQTTFRQIACFNFELELHKNIREKGAVSKDEIASLMNKHMKSYLGPIMEMKESDGYMFVTWSHIRRFFYVYSYAYGCLISKALYRKYKENPVFLEKIKGILYAGGSKSPQDIFNDIGIDTSNPAFWEEGLKSIEDDIKLLEKLTK